MRLIKKITLLSLSILTTLNQAYAGPVELYLQKQQEKSQLLVAAKNIHEATFTQALNHNIPEMGTFSQRYYIDESFSHSKNDPVFFYICGEAECTKRALNGAIRKYAKKYHAKLIALEHRYYGESIPLNTFSPDDLSYLTTEQALEDLAFFQRSVTIENQWQGKWVAFGGSYPGSLSAYYRLKHPDLVVGALASSAPVMAKEDFFEYDTHVTEVAGPKCAEQMREVVRSVEATLEDEQQLNSMKALFDATAVQDPVDFLYLIADTGAAAVQYGMKDRFCTTLSSYTTPLEGYAAFARQLYKSMGVNAVEMTAQGALSEDPSHYKNGVGLRQWYYQSCIEYGYWQNANPDNTKSTRSSLINLEYHHQICQRLFALNQPANITYINNTFYKPLMDGPTSNIYFTNGEQDPWSLLSLTEENGNALNPKLNYYLINNAAHCDDLRTPTEQDSMALRAARDILQILINQWLTS